MDPYDPRGQASIDYVAILGVIAVILGTAVAATGAPWLAPRVASSIRHGICVVSGALCTPREAREAGLAPCPINRRSDAERLGAVALIRLGREDALLVERRSDGTASVSFLDGAEAGVEAGMGVTLPGVAGTATAGVGVRFAAGQTFEFAHWPAARRFLARFAGEETLSGEGRRLLRGLCRWCPVWLKGHGRALPEPAARYIEGGSFDHFAAQLGVAVPGRSGHGPAALGLEVRGGRAVMLGRRRTRDQVTWYLRLTSDVVGGLGAVMGSIESGRHAEGVLEVTTESGRPVQARVRASAAVTGAGDLAGLDADLAGVADRVRAATTGWGGDGDEKVDGHGTTGLAVEAAVALDLRDAANLRAVEGLLHPGGSPLGWLERLRAVARRLDVAGAVDLTVSRVARDSTDGTIEGGELVRFGGGYGRVQETRDLIAAWSLAPGGRLRRREDCELAAHATA